MFKISLLLLAAASWALFVPLRVKDYNNTARNSVPVQAGIPLPEGAFQPADVSKFMVLDSLSPTSGQEVPSAIDVLTTWRGGSIRFVRVQFQATVAANGSRTYYLTNNNANTLSPTFSVTGVSGTITVETGVLKFTVKGTAFNLIDEAFVDLTGAKNYTAANQIIQAGHNGGLIFNGTRSSAGNATVTLYSKTDERAVIKATGTVGSFPYIVYVTAFRNKPYVFITHNFYYNNSDASSTTTLTDISMELPTLVTGTRNISAGNNTTTPVLTFTEAAADPAYAVSLSPDRTTGCYNVYNGTAVLGTGGSGGTGGNIHVGWMNAVSGTKGIGFGIRFFWEMYPKVIEMAADGRIKLGLYSYKASPLTYYAGGGRTHTAFVSFGDNMENAKEAFYNLTQPLVVMAPPVWYCGMTRSLDNLIHADATLLAPNPSPWYTKYRYFLEVVLKRTQTLDGPGTRYAPSNLNATDPVSHLFGFICFGDNTDPTNGYCPDQQHYSGNYYDYPKACLTSFIMNGDKDALIRAWECDLQMADIEHFNTTGDARGCPVVEHWFSYQNPTGTQCISPVPWGNANHWKTQSLFENYWFTGEPILLDLGKRINQFVMNNNGAITTGEARSAGHVLLGLSREFETEWNTAVRDRMRFFWTAGVQSFSNSCQTRTSEFLNQIVLYGLAHAIDADPAYAEWRTGMRNMVNAMITAYNPAIHGTCQNENPDLSGGELGPLAYAMDSMPDLVPALTPLTTDIEKNFFSDTTNYYKVNTSRQKLFTEMTKYIPLWFHRKVLDPNYLNNYPDYRNGSLTLMAERSVLSTGGAFGLSAYPNPGSGTVSLRLSGLSAAALSALATRGLEIYDVHGRRVDDLTQRMSPLMTWDASKFPAGIYVVRAKAAGHEASLKVMLMK